MIIATHLATLLLLVILLSEKFEKTCSSFYYILHKNSIGHLFRSSCFIFDPPPPPKVLFFPLHLNVRERDAKKAALPPPPFTPRNDRCNLSLSFL